MIEEIRFLPLLGVEGLVELVRLTAGCHKRSGLRPPETTAPTADDFAQKHNRIIAAMGQLESLSGMCCKS